MAHDRQVYQNITFNRKLFIERQSSGADFINDKEIEKLLQTKTDRAHATGGVDEADLNIIYPRRNF